jgi:hypothetical protein
VVIGEAKLTGKIDKMIMISLILLLIIRDYLKLIRAGIYHCWQPLIAYLRIPPSTSSQRAAVSSVDLSAVQRGTAWARRRSSAQSESYRPWKRPTTMSGRGAGSPPGSRLRTVGGRRVARPASVDLYFIRLKLHLRKR